MESQLDFNPAPVASFTAEQKEYLKGSSTAWPSAAWFHLPDIRRTARSRMTLPREARIWRRRICSSTLRSLTSVARSDGNSRKTRSTSGTSCWRMPMKTRLRRRTISSASSFTVSFMSPRLRTPLWCGCVSLARCSLLTRCAGWPNWRPSAAPDALTLPLAAICRFASCNQGTSFAS